MIIKYLPSLKRTTLALFLTGISLCCGIETSEAQLATKPVAVGTLKTTTGAALGPVQVFSTSSNAFGFWIRIRWSNGDVITEVPFETTESELRFSFIHYTHFGAGPDRVTGATWVERFSGKITFALAGASSAGILATMFYHYQGAQNAHRIPITPVRVVPVLITFR